MKKVSDVMTGSPQSCERTANLQLAANQMTKSNIGFLPVMDNNRKVIGTITDRDICLAIGRNSKTPKDIKVEEVMNKNVFTVKPEDDATYALNLMRTKQVGRLPVIDKDQQLVGVVTVLGVLHQIKNAPEKKELESGGTDNVLNALYALAERNNKKEPQKVAT